MRPTTDRSGASELKESDPPPLQLRAHLSEAQSPVCALGTPRYCPYLHFRGRMDRDQHQRRGRPVTQAPSQGWKIPAKLQVVLHGNFRSMVVKGFPHLDDVGLERQAHQRVA